MFYLDHRLTIIIGAYGSGKSEIAVNMSLAQRKALPDKKLLIADLDIVNPFYRSSDCGAVLEEAIKQGYLLFDKDNDKQMLGAYLVI